MGFVGNHRGQEGRALESPAVEHWQDVRERDWPITSEALPARPRSLLRARGRRRGGRRSAPGLLPSPSPPAGLPRRRFSRCGREAGTAWHRPRSAGGKTTSPVAASIRISYPPVVRSEVPRCRSASATRSNRSASSTSSARLRCATSCEVSHAKESSSGFSYQSAFAEATNESATRAESASSATRSVSRSVSTGALDQIPQRIPVVEQRRGDERLAVNESEAEQLAEDDLGRDAKRRRFLDRLQPLRERSSRSRGGGRSGPQTRVRTPHARRRSGGAAARPW